MLSQSKVFTKTLVANQRELDLNTAFQEANRLPEQKLTHCKDKMPKI
jgi:hypothetical protein